MRDSLLDEPDTMKGSTILQDDYNNHKALYFFCFFAIGITVNLGYCCICTSAQDLAKKFGYGDEMAIFNLSLIVFSVFVKFSNSRWLLGVPHATKVWCVGFGWTVGYALIIGASYCHGEEHSENSKNGLGFGLSVLGS